MILNGEPDDNHSACAGKRGLGALPSNKQMSKSFKFALLATFVSAEVPNVPECTTYLSEIPHLSIIVRTDPLRVHIKPPCVMPSRSMIRT